MHEIAGHEGHDNSAFNCVVFFSLLILCKQRRRRGFGARGSTFWGLGDGISLQRGPSQSAWWGLGVKPPRSRNNIAKVYGGKVFCASHAVSKRGCRHTVLQKSVLKCSPTNVFRVYQSGTMKAIPHNTI